MCSCRRFFEAGQAKSFSNLTNIYLTRELGISTTRDSRAAFPLYLTSGREECGSCKGVRRRGRGVLGTRRSGGLSESKGESINFEMHSSLLVENLMYVYEKRSFLEIEVMYIHILQYLQYEMGK